MTEELNDTQQELERVQEVQISSEKRKQIEEMLQKQSEKIEDGKKTYAKSGIFDVISKDRFDKETLKSYITHLEVKFMQKLINISKTLPSDLEIQFKYRQEDLDYIKELESNPAPEKIFELENTKGHLRETEGVILQLFDQIEGLKDRIDIDLEILEELKK